MRDVETAAPKPLGPQRRPLRRVLHHEDVRPPGARDRPQAKVDGPVEISGHQHIARAVDRDGRAFVEAFGELASGV